MFNKLFLRHSFIEARMQICRTKHFLVSDNVLIIEWAWFVLSCLCSFDIQKIHTLILKKKLIYFNHGSVSSRVGGWVKRQKKFDSHQLSGAFIPTVTIEMMTFERNYPKGNKHLLMLSSYTHKRKWIFHKRKYNLFED